MHCICDTSCCGICDYWIIEPPLHRKIHSVKEDLCSVCIFYSPAFFSLYRPYLKLDARWTAPWRNVSSIHAIFLLLISYIHNVNIHVLVHVVRRLMCLKEDTCITTRQQSRRNTNTHVHTHVHTLFCFNLWINRDGVTQCKKGAILHAAVQQATIQQQLYREKILHSRGVKHRAYGPELACQRVQSGPLDDFANYKT